MKRDITPDLMEISELLQIQFTKDEIRFTAIEESLVRIEDSFAHLNQILDDRFSKIDHYFDKVFQQLNNHSSRLKYIEENMVHKSQFKSLVGILERKEVITNFDASHVLYRPSE